MSKEKVITYILNSLQNGLNFQNVNHLVSELIKAQKDNSNYDKIVSRVAELLVDTEEYLELGHIDADSVATVIKKIYEDAIDIKISDFNNVTMEAKVLFNTEKASYIHSISISAFDYPEIIKRTDF